MEWNTVRDLIQTFHILRKQGKVMMLNKLYHEVRMGIRRLHSSEAENEDVIAVDADEGREGFDESSGSGGHLIHMH